MAIDELTKSEEMTASELFESLEGVVTQIAADLWFAENGAK